MQKRWIFVSCGQRTASEKSLGKAVKEFVDAVPGFAAYYAESVQSLMALRDHVFEAVQRSAGAIVLLHHRGEGRSSLWVNQEIAMLAYRQFQQRNKEIPLLVFKEEDVKIEGTMSESGHDLRFVEKWNGLSDQDRLILQAVVEEGSVDVTEASIRRWLCDKTGMEKAAASALLRERRLGLQQKSLVTLNTTSEGETIGLHPGNAASIVFSHSESVEGGRI